MIIAEFKRLFYSKKTILVLVLLFITFIVSVYFSYSEVQEFVELSKSSAKDLNQESVKTFLDESKAFYYFHNFFNLSDMYNLYVFILLVFVGVFLSSEGIARIKSGYGVFIQTRQRYRNHLFSLLIAQSLYILVLVSLSILSFMLFAFIFGGFKFGVSNIGMYKLGVFKSFMVLGVQILVNTIFLVFVNIISFSLYYRIRYLRVIQSLPLVGFMFLPLILASTLGNIVNTIGSVFYMLIPFNTLYLVNNFCNGNYSKIPIVYLLLLLVIAIYTVAMNVRKYSKDYL